MKGIISVFLLLLTISSCTTHKYGDFTTGVKDTLAEQVISDAVERLAKSYPVGKTIFRLDNNTTKDAGERLENGLRYSGFGVSYQEGIPLNYVFDNYSGDEKSGSKYRLTLVVDTVEFSRVYFFNYKQGELDTSSWTVVER